jgi:hypothetical protein
MKSEREIKSLYKNLLKQYFFNFIQKKTCKIPENCLFNTRHPLKSKNISDEENKISNNISSVYAKFESSQVIECDDGSSVTEFKIEGANIIIDKEHILNIDGDTIEISYHFAQSHNIGWYVDTIGICSIDKDLRICDMYEHSKNCPAFNICTKKSDIEVSFWEYAKYHHNDLMLLHKILDLPEHLPKIFKFITLLDYPKENKIKNII